MVIFLVHVVLEKIRSRRFFFCPLAEPILCVSFKRNGDIFRCAAKFQKQASKMPICYHAVLYVFHTMKFETLIVLSCKNASSEKYMHKRGLTNTKAKEKKPIYCIMLPYLITHTFNMFSCATVICFSSLVVQIYIYICWYPLGSTRKNTLLVFINERREKKST